MKIIIGGGSLGGGKGTVAGAFMGALFMGFIYNVMVIAGVNVYLQSIVIGVILLSAVSLDVILQKKFQV
jgi:ABC-type xylose transport system permease subunit